MEETMEVEPANNRLTTDGGKYEFEGEADRWKAEGLWEMIDAYHPTHIHDSASHLFNSLSPNTPVITARILIRCPCLL